MITPFLAAHPREDGFPGLQVWCSWCKCWHVHGNGYGHRAAHCSKAGSPYQRSGYVLADPASLPEGGSAFTGEHTERIMLDALHARYGAKHGNGPRYTTAEHVRTIGQPARGAVLRTADFVAMDLWASGNWELHGHEIKTSRSDWLRELACPEKAAEFIPYMNRWWLVVSDRAFVRDDELPEGWGLMALTGSRLTTVVPAPKRDALPLDGARLAGLLRAVAKTAAARALWERAGAA